MLHISKFIIGDLIRSRTLLVYLLFLSVIGWGMFFIESQPEKSHLVLLQVTLIVVPIFSLVFSGIYLYNSREFILLLLAQPLDRKVILNSQYIGLISSYTFAYFIGIGIPLLVCYNTPSSYLLIFAGILLTIIFSSIAIFIGVHFQDKAKGLGMMILLWAFFAFIFDGLLLLFMYQFGDYPIERLVMMVTLLNPMDTARISVIMQTEISAIMGLSGAVFRKIFGSNLGITLAFADLLLWCAVPYALARMKFNRKDF